MQNKIKSLIFILLIISSTILQAQNPSVRIVPQPNNIEQLAGFFQLNSETKIVYESGNDEVLKLADHLGQYLKFNSGLILRCAEKKSKKKVKENTIALSIDNFSNAENAESYTLTVSPKGIIISAPTAHGLFYGIQTFKQLIPIDKSLSIPAVIIKDSPRFKYRGLHLDVGRHLFPVEFIKKYIDLMSIYKLNTFHWHLTEDQGWRIEIKKYPELTRVSAYRNGTQIGKTNEIDTIRYGGFYTQDEIRDIVAYAADRYITVIPEIEMPGHSVAALAAYPELSCTGGPFEVRKIWGVSDDIYCAGNEKTFEFIENVLTEVMALFPSQYIHIGGDEAPHERWAACPKCQKRIHDEGLKDEGELQSYFIKRVEKFLNDHGRKLIGWDEIIEGGLAPDATVMAWRSVDAAIEAANQGHDVIMTPNDVLYFDHYQSDPDNEPLAIGGHTTLKAVYDYDPVPPVISAENAKHFLGPQANIWTEYAITTDIVEYRAFPRTLALAEIAWTLPENKNWESFLERMENQYPALKAMKVNYSKGLYIVSIDPVKTNEGLRYKLSSEILNADIRFTTNDTEPNSTSPKYTEPVKIDQSCNLKTAIISNETLAGKVNRKEININKAFGKSVTYTLPYSFKYKASGDIALTDGLFGGTVYKSGWQGFDGTDADFTVDLERVMPVNSISIGTITDPKAWVLFPENVEFSVSSDGNEWLTLPKVYFLNSGYTPKQTASAKVNAAGISARYIRVKATGAKKLPVWHEYKGEPCWLFFDELIVE